MRDSVIRADQLSKSFGKVRAVEKASFSMAKGAITVFLGRNGAGKTTVIKMLLGYLKPDSGRIQIETLSTGYVPERPVFYPWLKGREILLLTSRSFGISGMVLAKRMEIYGRAISFDTGLLSRRVQTYSLGNQKKFSYLQSLVISPDLLIVDEPFSSLDPVSIAETRELFLNLKREGRTVFLSSHIIAETEKICDEFIIINEGQIVVQEAFKSFREHHLLAAIGPTGSNRAEASPWARFIRKREAKTEMLIARGMRPAFERFLLEKKISAEVGEVDLEKIFLFFC